MKGDTEKTKEDKKADRRAKKTEKRIRIREKEKRQKLVEKLNPGLGNKYAKEKAMKDLEKQSKGTRSAVTVIKVCDVYIHFYFSICVFQKIEHIQGSHRDRKKWKSWKIEMVMEKS